MLCLVGLDTESMLCVRVCTHDCPQSQGRMSTILLGCSLPCPANPRVPHSTGVTGTLATPSFACGCLGLRFSWLHIECSYCVRVKWTMCEGHRTFGGLLCPSAMWVLRIRLRSSHWQQAPLPTRHTEGPISPVFCLANEAVSCSQCRYRVGELRLPGPSAFAVKQH